MAMYVIGLYLVIAKEKRLAQHAKMLAKISMLWRAVDRREEALPVTYDRRLS